MHRPVRGLQLKGADTQAFPTAGWRQHAFVERQILLLLEDLLFKQLDGQPALFVGLLCDFLTTADHNQALA
ncbi:hypothetical protein D3C72_2433390 [compost metagenome]